MFVGSVSKSKKVGFRHLHGDKTAQNYFVAYNLAILSTYEAISAILAGGSAFFNNQQ